MLLCINHCKVSCQEPQDEPQADIDDFGHASGSALVARLGWKSEDEYNSASSLDSLTATDNDDLERYCSFLDAYNAESISNTDSKCSFAAPLFSHINRLDHDVSDINVDETVDDIAVTDVESGSSTGVTERVYAIHIFVTRFNKTD